MWKAILCVISGLLAGFAVQAQQFDEPNAGIEASAKGSAIQQIQSKEPGDMYTILSTPTQDLEEEIVNAEAKVASQQADIAIKKAILDTRQKQERTNDLDVIKELAKTKLLDENNSKPKTLSIPGASDVINAE